MKQQLQKLMAALTLLLLCIPLQMYAQSTREVLQPQFGKQTITVASDEVITFKDPKGDTDYSGTTAENAHSLTVFQPAEAGMSIQITFESMNMGGSNNYYSFANVYSGNPDADNAFTWATTTSEVATTYSASILPSGNILRAYPNERNQTYTNETYVSASEDGIISVGFAYRYAYSCTGWVAKVKAVKLENMTVTGAGSDYEGVSAIPSSKQNVPLANAYVTATGVMNPDNVTGIYFSMTKNENVVDPTALKLYKGDTQIEATVSSDGTGYKFTLNDALADGTTTYTLKGDFLGTAEVGAKVQVDVTKVTTTALAEGVTPFTAAASVEVVNPAIVQMTSTPQTVTVNETPLAFYDEGGIDGGIVSKTNGQVTFLSGVSGKKVMVDFTKNEIWHGSLYNQELRIYNGQEVNAANLIKTLQKGETGVIRSTADDGSLTVVLFSDASNDVAANGWEATVSLFTPEAMDFDGAPTTEAASTATVCAGDTEQDMLTINVKAQNTEPAMQVTKMAFNAGENYALATKASLYFGNTKVGETDITVADFTITLNAAQTLVDGDNLFTLKYDISDEAQNDQKVSAKLVSVTAMVNGAEKTESTTAATAVERTVKNIVQNHKDQGTVTKYVNGSVAFETKPTSEYSTKYEYGDDTRTNIFIPKHDGMVCQIDFSEFAVYYASSTYGTRAKFIIYNGQGTTGEKLWELNDNAQQNTGPGTIIRSTAADGALTVVFSPNTTYSSYTLNGWKATVSEYETKDMEVNAIEVTQASTADMSVGAAGQELLNVNVKTEGSLNPLTMSSMKLNLKGTEANIAKVSVWQDDTKLAETAAAAEVEVTFGEAVTLAEGNNLFTVKVDIDADAENNSAIDAKVLSVHVGTVDMAVTNGDPEGERLVKNMIIIAAGDNGEVKVGTGKSVMFYDDGGPDADGADGVEATITFAPLDEGATIKLIDKGITFAATAHLYIYEGGAVDNDKLIVDLSGSSAKFDPIVSNAADGKITIKYVGKGSYTRPNFAIEVQGYQKKAFEVKNYTVTDVSGTNVMAGQEDVQMLRIDMTVEGDYTPLEIQQFNIEALQDVAIDKIFVYATDTISAFSSVNKFGEAQAGTTNVVGTYTIDKDGVYKFWVAYNIKNDAAVGAQASAKLTSFTISGTATEVTEDVTATVAVKAGMHGTFTVGTGGDYPTIQAAVDAVSSGVDGPVIINIKNGEYNEQVNVPHIPGTSSTNTITLQSESGDYLDVKIYHNSYSYPVGAEYQVRQKGVITVSGCDWFTLKNVEVTTTDNTYPGVVQLKNESRHVTIEGCYLHAETSTNAQQSIGIINMTAIDEANCNNDYITIKDNLIEGGYIGMRVGGTGYVRLPKEVGAVIEGNTLRNNGTKSIYVTDELGAKIRNNTIVIDADAETKISVGILDMQLRDEYSEPFEITGNIFNVAPKTYAAVFNLRQVEATASAPMLIANNVINLTSLNASYSPFKLAGAKVKNLNIAHNTIRMTGTNGGAAFWLNSKLDAGYDNINVVNNIIQNETSGYAVNLYNDENLRKVNFQNNVVYTEGTNFFRAATATSGDFEVFVEKTGATGCVNKKVNFLSESVLEPADDLDGDLLTAQALSYVTTDITGKNRPTENITIGAYEYNADSQAPVMLDTYPKVVSAIDGKATLAVKTDLAATVYCIVKKASEAAPTIDELKVSETKKDVSAETETTFEIDGLEDNEQYIAYFLPIGLRGAEGVITQTETFTMTTTPPVTDKPEADVYINNSTDEDTVEAGSSVTLMAMVTVDERTAPYTLTWMDSKHNVLLTETYESVDDIDDIFMVSTTPTECTDYIFIVKDNAEKADTAFVRAILTGDAVTATFENLYLDSESYWHCNDSRTSFVSGSYKFESGAMPEWNFYYNFSYSNQTHTTYTSLADQHNSAVGSGVDGSENYAVTYPQGGKIHVLNNAEGDSIRGFYITNSAWVVDAIVNGDGYEGAFAQGDYFKVIITADNGKSTEYYLADYRSTNTADHYYLDTWQWVDLTSLGKVKNLSFAFDGTKKNSYGLTTPTYFCLDNFNGERNEVTAPVQTAEDGSLTADVDDFTTLDEGAATKTYEIADELPDGITATVDADGTLNVTGSVEGTFDIVVKVTQKGKTEYIRVPVTIATGIRLIGINVQDVEGYYTIDGKRLETPQRGINIVRMKNGETKKLIVR